MAGPSRPTFPLLLRPPGRRPARTRRDTKAPDEPLLDCRLIRFRSIFPKRDNSLSASTDGTAALFNIHTAALQRTNQQPLHYGDVLDLTVELGNFRGC